ncbi:MAG TPA: hypothetical protein VFS21_19895 [Roseiflexaceae bacterium]|nr:hypothetical protein [Roseiflexaceae bacterium]
MPKPSRPQPPPHGTAEATEVCEALMTLTGEDLLIALELMVWADDAQGTLRTQLGYTRELVPGRTRRAKPVEQLVPPTPAQARAALRACAVETLRTQVLPPLARALRSIDPEVRPWGEVKAGKLVVDLARRLASPTWRDQLLAAQAHLHARRAAAAAAAEERRRARAEARRPWEPGEVRQLAGHPVERTEDGGYRCSVCGWVWNRKPQTTTECPGMPRYVRGSVPDHLKTERQLRQDDRVAPTAPAVAVLHLRHQHGMDYVPLYDVAQVRPLQQRAAPRRRCQRCRAFIPREATDQELCATCGPIAAEEQAQRDAERRARHEAHQRLLAELGAERPAVPLTIPEVLAALGDLWLLNRRARTLDPDTREIAYALKSAVLASIWRATGAADRPLIRDARTVAEATAAHFGLKTWDFSEQHAIDLSKDAGEQRLGVVFGHVEAKSGYDDWRSYLSLTFFSGAARYPFHVPFHAAQAWFPPALWSACERRRWTEQRPYTFGGGTFTYEETQAIDWKRVLEHLSRVIGQPQLWEHFDLATWHAPPWYPWYGEDDAW